MPSAKSGRRKRAPTAGRGDRTARGPPRRPAGSRPERVLKSQTVAVETPGKERLAEQRRALPDQPGVYLFRDARGRVIYVGKAKSIRKRVASHFSARGTMIGFIDHIEYLVVASEQEALLTEQTFIKQYKPRFNIRLRDDKSYPYIAISLDEDFPRVYFTRERHRRDRVYFGPYSSAKRVRGTLDLLGKIFLFRSCEGAEPGRRSGSPCLDYHIKRCGAPCVGYVTKQEYRRGDRRRRSPSSRGASARSSATSSGACTSRAGEQDYEQAAVERNRLQAVRQLLERQRVATEGAGTFDAVAVAADGMEANAQVFQVRDGVLSDRQSFYLDNQAEQEPAIVAEEFLLQYYTSALAIPSLIVVQQDLAEGSEPEVLAALLSERRGGAVEIRAAERGGKRRILELAERNARLALDQEKLKAERRRQQRVDALTGCRPRSGSTRCPCGSSASTSRTSAAPIPSPPWSCSRAARRRRPITAASPSAPWRAPTISPPWQRSSAAGTPSGRRSTSAPRTTPIATSRSPRSRT